MQFSRSPISKTPLLSSAQNPGVSQRLSDSSLASHDQHLGSHSISMSSTRMGGSSTSSSSFSSARFGPTARLLDNAGSGSGSGSKLGRGSGKEFGVKGAGGVGLGGTIQGDDEDDLDDHLHTFTAAEKRDPDGLNAPFDITSFRGWANALTLVVLAMSLVGIFALYPILSWYYNDGSASGRNTAGYNLGGINATGQFPLIPNLPRLIDPDTPEEVYTRTGFDNKEWKLVYSDEFNKDGRTFYEGDDPFWTAMDIHYWPTGDFEWLDPSAVTTKDGHLVITMNQENIHDLNLKSGMIQSWNKLCFNKNAYFEVSASLPGTSGVGGFWPGVWTMGNLGRPGYGATTEGVWPYSYDSCDIGTLANQTYPNGTGPALTLTTSQDGGPLSFLPGQRVSACTCPGEDHPGPDVTKGRASPEIDMIEAQIRIAVAHGEVSQSNQLAPYDDYYQFNNASGMVEIYDPDATMWNTYLGGHYQQAVSGLTLLPDRIYNDQIVGGRSGEFATFGFEYSAVPEAREKGYIHWIADGKPSWTMYADAIAENPRTEVGRRIISEEPMALIVNLHASNNFQNVDFAHMKFPNYFRLDYIRVYQRNDGSGSIGCDPEDYPTKDYIERHKNAYTNANLTTWAQAGYTFPKNKLIDTC